tara:strand:+ start:3064 stop:4167 length:1104 start_codon:yes stop_codon:yes gene_type:complete
MTDLKIFCNVCTTSPFEGYGYAFTMLQKELINHGIRLDTVSDLGSSKPKLPPHIMFDHIKHIWVPKEAIEKKYEIVINNCLPTEYIDGGNYRVGFTYWESSRVPNLWADHMRECDEIWTTSKWCKQVFEDQKVNKIIKNFDLGVNEKVYPIYKKVPDQRKFRFLHVGSPSSRKNIQMAIDAFMKLFDGNEDYELVIKCIGYTEGRYMKNGAIVGNINMHPQVTIVSAKISEDELSKMYRQAHCLVYPTSGEGWGLIPFSAMASGTPTICTNATSCTEFAHLGLPLDYKWVDVNEYTMPNDIYHGSQWASPDMDHLIELMIHVSENYESEKARAVSNATLIHEKYAWSNVTVPYSDRIKEIQTISNRR